MTPDSSPGHWSQSLLPRSLPLHNYQDALSHPDAFGSIVNSLKLSLAAVAMASVFGLLAAYVIVRTKIKGRHALDAMCMLPLAVPGLVVAFGYVAMTLKWPFVAFSDGGPGPLGFVSVLGNNP